MNGIVHIRVIEPTQGQTYYVSLCGEPYIESISIMHFVDHVDKYRHDCCEALFGRLCRQCMLRATSAKGVL